MSKKICIIGAGMFGYAMANYIARLSESRKSKDSIFLYDLRKNIIESLKDTGRHPIHFQEIDMHKKINPTSDLEETVSGSDILINVTDSKNVRASAKSMKPYIDQEIIILNLAKGLEEQTEDSKKKFLRLSDVINEELDGLEHEYSVVALSGGMIAREFIKGNPLFATIAAADTGSILGRKRRRLRNMIEIRNYLTSGSFFLEISDDIKGIEYAGPLKNVIAIAVGIGVGMNYEASTLGGFISAISGEAEYIAMKMGAKSETFSMKSQAWGGDLMATCFGNSRNRAFGIEIGKGIPVESALDEMRRAERLVEGYHTTKIFYEIAVDMNIADKVPIITQTYEVLYNNKTPSEALGELIRLPIRGR